MNLAIREFSEKMIKEINTSNLPLGVVRLVLKDILGQVEKTEESLMMKEMIERNQQQMAEANKENVEPAEVDVTTE